MKHFTILLSLILILVFLIIGPTEIRAQGTDTTTISHSIGTSYVGLFDTLFVSFDFQEPTIAVEGRLTFDSDRMILTEVIAPVNTDDLGTFLLFDNPDAFESDTTAFVVGWALASNDLDSLGFVFAPVGVGTHTAALSFLEFDEREPANDGIDYYAIVNEVRPLAEFGGFVNTEDFVEKQEACDAIRNWFYPSDLRGDASGNGDISALDASLILQLQALLIDEFPASSVEFVLPAFCDGTD